MHRPLASAAEGAPKWFQNGRFDLLLDAQARALPT